MTRDEFVQELLTLATGDAVIYGLSPDFVLTNGMELVAVGEHEDIPPGVYLHYEFYATGREYKYQGYMPVTLDTFKEFFCDD